MKKKIYLAPNIEVVDVEMETILAGSATEGTTTGSGDVNFDGGEEEEVVENGSKMNQQTLWDF